MERYWSFFAFLSILSKFHRKMNRNSSWLLSPLSCLTQITIIQFHWWQKKKRLNRRQNKRPAKSKTILQLHFVRPRLKVIDQRLLTSKQASKIFKRKLSIVFSAAYARELFSYLTFSCLKLEIWNNAPRNSLSISRKIV